MRRLRPEPQEQEQFILISFMDRQADLALWKGHASAQAHFHRGRESRDRGNIDGGKAGD